MVTVGNIADKDMGTNEEILSCKVTPKHMKGRTYECIDCNDCVEMEETLSGKFVEHA